jgi:hypothetical protein
MRFSPRANSATTCTLSPCPHPRRHPQLAAASPDAVLRDYFVDAALPAVLRLFDDASEGNREAAIALVAACVDAQHAGGRTALHPRVFTACVAAIAGRVARAPPAEHSEELRLALAKLLNALLLSSTTATGEAATGTAAATAATLPQLVDVLHAEAGDGFPSVKLEAAGGVMHLARALPHRVHMAAGTLARALLPCLGHQRGPVRLAALDALGALMPHGGEGWPGVLADAVLPALQPLRVDRLVSVRKQAATLLGLVVRLTAAAAAADAAGSGGGGGLLAPAALYMALALTGDDTPEVAAHAAAVLEHAAAAVAAADAEAPSGETDGGAAAEREQPGDLAVAAAAAAAAVSDDGASLPTSPRPPLRPAPSEEDWAAQALPHALLPPPFDAHGAPSHALRVLTARLLPGVLPLAVAEAVDWAGHTRVSACGALRALVAVAGAAVARVPGVRLADLLAVLCARVRADEDEPAARALALDTARLIGACVPPEEWLAHGLLPMLLVGGDDDAGGTGVVAPPPSPPTTSTAATAPPPVHCPSRAAALALLATATTAADPHALAPLLPSLVRALAQPSLAYVEDAAADDTGSAASDGAWRDAGPDSRLALARAALAAVHVVAADLTAAEGADTHARHMLSSSHRLLSTGHLDPPPPPSSSLSTSEEAPSPATTRPHRRHHVTPGVVDGLLRTALHLQWRGEDDGEGTAEETTRAAVHDLAAAYFHHARKLPSLGDAAAATADGDSPEALDAECRHLPAGVGARGGDAVDLIAVAAHRLLPAIVAASVGWGVRSPARREFDTLLRVARPALCGRSRHEARRLAACVVHVFAVTLHPGCAPELRVAQLALLDSFIVGGSSNTSSSGASGDDRGSGSAAPVVTEPSSDAQTTRRRPSAGRMDDAGVVPVGPGVAAAAPLPGGAVAATSSPLPDVAPLSPSALPPAARHALDVVPDTTVVRASSAPLSAALSGASTAGGGNGSCGGVHTVSDLTLDDVLASDDADGGDGGDADEGCHAAGAGGGTPAPPLPPPAVRLVRDALLPSLAWRPGGVASTLRKVAAACIHAALRRGLLRPAVLARPGSCSAALQALTAALTSAAGDDDGTTRLLAVQSASLVAAGVGGPHVDGLTGAAVLALVAALRDRLDDGVDAVRVAACDGLAALAAPYLRHARRTDTGNAGHATLDALALHLGDPAPPVRAAVWGALRRWVDADVPYAAQLAAAGASSGAPRADPALAAQFAALCAAKRTGGGGGGNSSGLEDVE